MVLLMEVHSRLDLHLQYLAKEIDIADFYICTNINNAVVANNYGVSQSIDGNLIISR